MPISTVVTLGYGTFGSVNYIVTLGYGDLAEIPTIPIGATCTQIIVQPTYELDSEVTSQYSLSTNVESTFALDHDLTVCV